MPFYIFKVAPSGELDYLDVAEKYRPARDKVRELRKNAASDGETTYRMIFANSVAQGEKLLTSSAQEDKIIGDD